MVFFSRSNQNDNGPDPVGNSSYSRPAPVYIGFAEPEPDLYEFRTDAGAYVFLHELDCTGVRYRPLTRDLTFTFDGGPTDLVPAMTVALMFGDAEIFQWEPLGEPAPAAAIETAARLRGQVSAFDSLRDGPNTSYPGVSFHLSLLDLAIGFFASSVSCEVSEGLSASP